MHSHPVLPSLAVDGDSIHLNSGKVKHKMQKRLNFFQVVTVSNCRHLILHFSGLYIFNRFPHQQKCITSKTVQLVADEC